MQPSLLVLNGRSRETMPFQPSWQAQIATLIYEAQPVLALQSAPPALLYLSIERRRSASLQHLHQMLYSSASELSLIWQTFCTTDGSVAESFLIITPTASALPPVRLRFCHASQLPVLEAIAETGHLAIQVDGSTPPVLLSCDATELREQLACLPQLSLNTGRYIAV